MHAEHTVILASALLSGLSRDQVQAFVEYAIDRVAENQSTQEVIRAIYPDVQFTPTEKAAEQWKKILGFSDYEVSNLGQVRNQGSLKLVKQSRGKNGHRQVAPRRRGGKNIKVYVHQLVATAFLAVNEANRDLVNHKDNDPANNRASNLEWCNNRENQAHSTVTGRRPAGRNHHQHKKRNFSPDLKAALKLVSRNFADSLSSNTKPKSQT
jgi:HNH endonuclease/NUMOD4 motif